MDRKDNMNCAPCDLCTPNSKNHYPFRRDLDNSEELVNTLITMIETYTPYLCTRPHNHKDPDIVVYYEKTKQLICRIEAKQLGSKAFMKSKEYIGLMPKEALVIDEPKFLHYLDCKINDDYKMQSVPIFIVWQWLRPCPDLKGIIVYQELSILEKIYKNTGGRKFRRRTANSDFVNNQQKGIIDKIHFSRQECLPIDLLLLELNKIVPK